MTSNVKAQFQCRHLRLGRRPWVHCCWWRFRRILSLETQCVSELHFDKFPALSTFSCWKIRVTACSDFPFLGYVVDTPPVFIPLPPWGTVWRRRRMPPLVLMTRDWFRSLFSRFAVETVHNCDCFSKVWSEFHRCLSAWFVEWDKSVFLISLVLLRRWAVGVVFLCPLTVPMHFTSVQPILSYESRYAGSRWKRSYISCARCGPQNALSVRRFCRAEHIGVSPS